MPISITFTNHGVAMPIGITFTNQRSAIFPEVSIVVIGSTLRISTIVERDSSLLPILDHLPPFSTVLSVRDIVQLCLDIKPLWTFQADVPCRCAEIIGTFDLLSDTPFSKMITIPKPEAHDAP